MAGALEDLQTQYNDAIVTDMMKEFGYSNTMEVPKLEKISVNIGLGDAVQNSKLIDGAVIQLGQITGQFPIVTRARKSIAGFKLREGQAIGCRGTLRGERMWEFLDRLITIAIPRIRDFRGIKRKSFDGRGNFSMGLADQLVFPEIKVDNVEWPQGMTITAVMTGNSDEMSLELLSLLGMPFRKN